MAWASYNCALRVRRGVALNSLSAGMKGVASEDENEGAGGSCTRDDATEHYAFLVPMAGSRRVWVEWMFEWERKASSRSDGLLWKAPRELGQRCAGRRCCQRCIARDFRLR